MPISIFASYGINIFDATNEYMRRATYNYYWDYAMKTSNTINI